MYTPTSPLSSANSGLNTSGLNTSLSLRLRILIVALLPLLVGVGLFAAYFAHRTISQAETALDAQGRNAAQRLAESVALDLFSGNLPYVKRLVDLERNSLHALSIAITDGQQWVLVSGTSIPLPPPPGFPAGRAALPFRTPDSAVGPRGC